MAQTTKLFQVLSGLLNNDKKLKGIINKSGVYDAATSGTIDERLIALSGALNTESTGAYKGVETSGSANGLTIGDIDPSTHKQSISLALADGESAGTIKGSSVATIANGQITAVSEAGKVTNKLTAFGKDFDGSAAVEIKVSGDYLTQTSGVVGLTVNGAVSEGDTGLVTGGTVHTAIEGAKTALIGSDSDANSIKGVAKALADYQGTNNTAVEANTAKLAGLGEATVSAQIAADIKAAKNAIIGGSVSTGEVPFGGTLTELATATDNNKDNISTLSSALTDYTGANAVKTKFEAIDGKLSGVTTVSGSIADAKTELLGNDDTANAGHDTIKSARAEAAAASKAVTNLTSGAVKTNSDNIATVSGTVDKHVAILAGIGGSEAEPTTVAAAIDADVLAAKKEILGTGSEGTPLSGETNKELRADINANDAEIATLNKALSGYAGENAVSAKFANIDGKLTGVTTVSGSIADAKEELSGLIGTGYTSTDTVKKAIDAIDTKVGTIPTDKTYANVIDYVDKTVEAAKGEVQGAALGIKHGKGISFEQVTDEKQKNLTKINVVTDGKTIGLAADSDGAALKSLLTLNKLTSATEGYAASYQLQDADGTKLGDIINIPKDQFLSGATYVPSSQTLDLTFAVNTKNEFGAVTQVAHTVPIKVSEFFTAYEAGAGLNLKTEADGKTSFEITKDPANDDNKFLQIGVNGIGLTGITSAFTAADTTLSGNLVGTDGSASTTDTIKGAKKHADEKVIASAKALIGGTAEGDADIITWEGSGDGSLDKLLTDVTTLNGQI